MTRVCRACGKPVTRKSKTGYCRPCAQPHHVTNVRLAAVPPEYRDDYRNLTRRHRFRAAEAVAMILEMKAAR